MLDEEDIATQFLPLLKDLATDRIVNVRICVAKLLASHLKNKSKDMFYLGPISTNSLFVEVVETIKKDKNTEIIEELEED